MKYWFKFNPVYKSYLWGGDELKKEFNYPIPTTTTGEAWVISAHPQGESLVAEGKYAGMPLSALYRQDRSLFGPGSNLVFPLLIKLIDAKKDLSVQVHPDDAYALTYENSLGKAEAWYIIKCEPKTKMIVGHHAQTKAQFTELVQQGNFKSLLNVLSIQAGDCYDIRPGTLHAICAGTLVYEVQQNSNITYRVFDYDRLDDQGNKRQLHLQKAIDVTTCPADPVINQNTEARANQRMELINNDYFKLSKLTVTQHTEIKLTDVFMIISVVSGEGTFNGLELRKGDHIIVFPEEKNIEVYGNCFLLLTQPTLKSML